MSRDFSRLYDQAELAYWQTRYPVSTEKILAILLDASPSLTEEERRLLSSVQLHFPLPGEGEHYDPFTYYVTADPPTVVMPILSLKFLDDLSIAYAWLWAKGYSLETVADYVAMLKYRGTTLTDGPVPPPLEALQIPANALDDPEIDSLSLDFFNTARTFILAHELGHIHHRHSDYENVSRDQARQNEAAADSFALELMSNTGTIPFGIALYFMAEAHWVPNRWDFQDEQMWQAFLDQATHPLTAHRLRDLTAQLQQEALTFALGQPSQAEQIRYIATELSAVAQLLEDEEVQAVIRAVGLATDVSSLAPRRPDETP